MSTVTITKVKENDSRVQRIVLKDRMYMPYMQRICKVELTEMTICRPSILNKSLFVWVASSTTSVLVHDDDVINRFLRSSILSAGWRFGDTDTINTAVSMFNSWMNRSSKRCFLCVSFVVFYTEICDVCSWYMYIHTCTHTRTHMRMHTPYHLIGL